MSRSREFAKVLEVCVRMVVARRAARARDEREPSSVIAETQKAHTHSARSHISIRAHDHDTLLIGSQYGHTQKFVRPLATSLWECTATSFVHTAHAGCSGLPVLDGVSMHSYPGVVPAFTRGDCINASPVPPPPGTWLASSLDRAKHASPTHECRALTSIRRRAPSTSLRGCSEDLYQTCV